LPSGLPTLAAAGSVKDNPGHLHDIIFSAPRIANYRDIQYLHETLNFQRADFIFKTIGSTCSRK
jgi:hypothetical protein